MAKFKALPPLEELQKILSYDPETGVFTWKVRPSKSIVEGSVAGSVDSTGYRKIRLKKKAWLAHRLAWLFGTGKDPGDLTVDHINRDPLDNRLQNLRLATRQQQQCNTGVRLDNKSGFKGVSFSRKRSQWVAYIGLNGKNKNLGWFATKEEAAAAYQEAAASHYGEFMAS